MDNLTNTIEAILFVAGGAVPIADIADKLQVTEHAVKKSLDELKLRYGTQGGILLLEFNKKAQLASNPSYKDNVAAVLNPIREKELTKTLLECAAIIAYKQPITRAEIEMIRGTNSNYGVDMLLELKLIYPCGRKDAVGHPVMFATTDEFLKRFKLESLDQLPDYEELMDAITEFDDRDNYLYARAEWGDITVDEEGGENAAPQPTTEEDPTEEKKPRVRKEKGAEEVVEGGYEIPDFLKGLDDTDIVKIS